MKARRISLLLILAPLFAYAQNPSSMLGEWRGISNSVVLGSGLFHPTEEGKEKSVRFRNVEYLLAIHKVEGRNFVGSIGSINSNHPTDVNHKEVVLGAYAKDMKSGVMTNESGSFTFKIEGPKNIEICYTQVSSKPKVASCFEMFKQ